MQVVHPVAVPRLPRAAGFTLIEMLMVVFLIGMVVGGVSVFITQDGADTRTNKAVEKFVVIADHISELSILNGDPIGLMLEPPEWQDNPLDAGWRYRWQKMSPQGMWVDLEEVAAVDLEPQLELLVLIDEQPWEYENAPKVRLPIAVFYPSGEVTPFEIEFSHEEVPGQSQTVLVDVWGSVVWKERQDHAQEEEDF